MCSAPPTLPRLQVDLYCECPLWPDDGMCSLRDCSVCECEEHEVPEPWRKAEAVEACDSGSRPLRAPRHPPSRCRLAV